MEWNINILPVVERELRAGSRRKLTYYGRLITVGLTGLMISQFFAQRSSIPPAQLGRMIMTMMSGISLAYCLLIGVRSSSDAISEERREGTLGLLFLTGLRGHDIVFGKLAANALNLFYGVLALAPMLAIPLMLGGVTGGEFARSVLALLNSLWLATSLALWVSARHEEEQRSFWTAATTLFVLVVMPVFPWIVLFPGYVPQGVMTFGSPIASLVLAGGTTYPLHRSDYWISLAIGHLIGWGCLLGASSKVAAAWRESGEQQTSPPPGDVHRVSEGNRPPQKQARAALLESNPTQWLLSRRSKDKTWTTAIVGAWLVCGVLMLFFLASHNAPGTLGLSRLHTMLTMVQTLSVLILHLGTAISLTAFLCEGRRSGALELLLTTPLGADAVIGALRRQGSQRLWKSFLFYFPWVAATTYGFMSMTVGTTSFPGTSIDIGTLLLIQNSCGLLAFISGQYALKWFGMWVALRAKKPGSAATIAFLIIVSGPWLALSSVSWLILPRAGGYGQLLMPVIVVSIRVALALTAKRRLQQSFRKMASGDDTGWFRKQELHP